MAVEMQTKHIILTVSLLCYPYYIENLKKIRLFSVTLI